MLGMFSEISGQQLLEYGIAILVILHTGTIQQGIDLFAARKYPFCCMVATHCYIFRYFWLDCHHSYLRVAPSVCPKSVLVDYASRLICPLRYDCLTAQVEKIHYTTSLEFIPI
jgi:hypothetical protein